MSRKFAHLEKGLRGKGATQAANAQLKTHRATKKKVGQGIITIGQKFCAEDNRSRLKEEKGKRKVSWERKRFW